MPSLFHKQRFLLAPAEKLLGRVGEEIAGDTCFYAILLFLLGMASLSLHTSLLYSSGELSFAVAGSGIFYYLGAIGLAGALVLALTGMLLRHKVDAFSIACFILAAIVSLHYIHISNNFAYTNDLWGHMARIQYMTSHWLEPYNYTGRGVPLPYPQIHQPPMYYYMAGAMYWIVGITEVSLSWTAVRFFSWCSYLLFNVYSLLTLRRIKTTGMAYYSAAALLLLWPVGLHGASKINPDPLYYALSAISFYYAIFWYQQKDQRKLFTALIFAGLAFTVRTNALLLFIIIGALLLMECWKGHFKPEKRFLKHYIGVTITLILCGLLNMGRLLLGKISFKYHMGAYTTFRFDPAHYLSIDLTYVFRRPFSFWNSYSHTFLEYFFKTSIFGDLHWPWPGMAAVLNILLLLIVAYVAFAWCMSMKQARQGLFPFAVALFVPFAFLVAFRMLNQQPAAQDFRYIHPSLVCIAVFYKRSMEIYEARGMARMSVAGSAIAYSFVLLSVIFFWCNGR